jgi:hypothetical protein
MLRVLIVLGMFAGGHPAMAGELTVAPWINISNGWTQYTIRMPDDITDSLTGNSFGILAKSQLEYPLDVVLAGVEITETFRTASNREFHFTARAWTNVTQPGNRMLDSDWMGTQVQELTGNTELLWKFSYTESPAVLQAWGGKLTGDLPSFRFFGRAWELGLSYQIDHFDYDIRGIFSGWQADVFDSAAELDSATGFPRKIYLRNLFADTSVLTYQVTYHTVTLTGHWHPCQRNKYRWDIDGSFSPLVLVNDADDHLLRGKNSTARTRGVAFECGSEFVYFLSNCVSLGMEGGVRYVYTRGQMTQRFYADDPGSPDDETGMVFKDIDTWIELLTGQAGIKLEYSF